MRTETHLNYDWKYIEDDDDRYSLPSFDDSLWENVDLPHTMRLLPFHYVNDDDTCLTGWYRKHIPSSMIEEDRMNILRFEGVAMRGEVYLNGKKACVHDGGFTPFTVEIPEQLRSEGDFFVVAVRCDSRQQLPIAPYGHVIDYLIPGGMYREVSFLSLSRPHIDDVFTYSKSADRPGFRKVHSHISLQNVKGPSFSVEQSIIDEEGTVVYTGQFTAENEKTVCTYFAGEVKMWDCDNPVLYIVRTRLLKRGVEIDRYEHDMGFRDAFFTPEGFFLNGKKIVLKGLNRHQLYPYAGFAMPASQQRKDAEFLKNTLHVNIVRTSHYPQSPHFLKRCDQLGLLVFTELPGWQHISDDRQWRENLNLQLKEMIIQDRNHPSVILWGVRVNESKDCDELYLKTNETARFFDESRQTGGVRNFAGSRLLEDVYTYNDFSQPGLKKARRVTGRKNCAYLVTEHTGHMYPVRFEENGFKHNILALYHAKKLQALYDSKHISGAIGWCMSDYYTHRQFGAGDSVCHHGVSDQFRLLKTAGYLYSSQGDRPFVMHLADDLAIGNYPAHALRALHIYTNCDSVRLFCNERFVGHYFPEYRKFPSLVHPPVIISDTVGALVSEENGFSEREKRIIRKILVSMQHHSLEPTLSDKLLFFYLMKKRNLTYEDAVSLVEKYLLHWDDNTLIWRFEGIYKGEVVKTVVLEPYREGSLRITTESDALEEKETYDVKRIVVSHVDQNGQILRLSNEPVSIEISPEISLIGDDMISLRGGQGAFYVRSNRKEGLARITVRGRDGLCASTVITVLVS